MDFASQDKSESSTTSNNDAGKAESQDNKGIDLNGNDFQDCNGQHHPIAEFLYQLTKMLTDDNSEIIEWADGRIKVHYPERLEAEVLHKYFRHSKFASFQRQLNYFGFRKIAGKGKMSPCSYVNEAATSDIRSLLLIKRKTNGSAARKAAMQQRAAALSNTINPAILGMNLSALAANPQAMAGGMNSQALSNAMALLSENALRAGLGQFQQQQPNAQLSLLALHQQQLQQQLQQHQQQQVSQEHLLLPQHMQQSQAPGPAQAKPAMKSPSLEQLHAQLAANLVATQQQQQNAGAPIGMATAALQSLGSMPATAALKSPMGATSDANPASAALQAQNNSNPATAAMDAANNASSNTNNLFESAINLKSLLQEHQESANRQHAAMNHHPSHQAALLNHRLPSSNQIFPDSMSTVSLGNLLGSSNRLNSLLSLNSFMGSREASLADFAAASNAMTAQLQAAGANNPQMHADGRRG